MINVGLAVGLSVGLFVLVLFIGVPLCIIVRIYCFSGRKTHLVRTRVVATTASAGITTSNQTGTSTAAPYDQTGTSTAALSNHTRTSTAAPVAYPQEPVYKDTQFSNQDAPPSYTDAIALPNAQVTAYIALYNVTCAWV